MPPRGGNRLELGAAVYGIIVSTHAPARGQSAADKAQKLDCSCFNSCPREGAITLPSTMLCQCSTFQLMPPRGGNHLRYGIFLRLTSFNSCPREGAIVRGYKLTFYAVLFQLMPPRGGNRRAEVTISVKRIVSTHAPARGQSALGAPGMSDFEFQLMPPRGGNL